MLHERNGGFYDRCLECHRKEIQRLTEALERVVEVRGGPGMPGLPGARRVAAQALEEGS